MKFISVTTKELYSIQDNQNLEDFLKTFEGNLNSHHAWRDGNKVGNSKRIVSIQVLDDINDYFWEN